MLTIPEFTDIDATFGARLETYPHMKELPETFQKVRDPHCDVARKLFFKGGKLSDFGLRFKPGIDGQKAMTAIRSWLCSFEPSHEHKIATVGFALSEWCERCEVTTPEPPKSTPVRKKGKRSKKIKRRTP